MLSSERDVGETTQLSKHFSFMNLSRVSGAIGLALVIGAASSATANAQTYVNGYTRSDGTYVQGHYRSSPNSTQRDNYSTYGNVNPYTGRTGTQKCGLYESCY